MKPYIFKAFEQENAKEDFGVDTSLTSLNWLQKLNCRTGLSDALQTPTSAPPPRLSLQRDLASGGWKTPQNLLDRLPSTAELDEAIKKEHQIAANINWAVASELKPPHNYATMIYMAVRSTPNAKVTLNDVYLYIQRHFQYYRVANPGWKNSIRHNLTQNKFFKKTMRPDSDEGPCKGGFWTLDINIENIGEFSRGIWRQSKVRTKPSPSKAGSKKPTKGGPKGSKSGKLTKGISKVGKNSPKNSPKNRRKSSVSSTGSLNSPTIALANMTLQQKKKKTKTDRDLPSEMMSGSWNLFGDNDDVFHDVKLFDNLYSGGDAEMISCDEELENALVEAPGDSGYDSPAAAAILASPTKPLHARVSEIAGTTSSIASEVDGCFALSDGLAKFGSGITPTDSFDDLVSGFSHIKPSEMSGLEVVGVGMNLLPPTDTLSPSLSKIKQESLAHLMNDFDDGTAIPLDWNL